MSDNATYEAAELAAAFGMSVAGIAVAINAQTAWTRKPVRRATLAFGMGHPPRGIPL